MKPKITVCIAEDHALLRNSTISILKEYGGFNVLFGAENGRDLMNKFETSIPDIVLLDISMPVMDGIEALHLIRVKYPQIKVIMYSSHYDRFYIRETINAGAVGFLSKNCMTEELFEAINTANETGFYYSKFVKEILEKK